LLPPHVWPKEKIETASETETNRRGDLRPKSPTRDFPPLHVWLKEKIETANETIAAKAIETTSIPTVKIVAMTIEALFQPILDLQRPLPQIGTM
jgi:hypothetical protein